MPFVKPCIFPSDIHDAAVRLAKETTAELMNNQSGDAQAQAYGECLRKSTPLGWTLVFIPESDDGFGGTLTDVASIAEAMSEAAIPYPVMEMLLAPAMLARADPSKRLLSMLRDQEGVHLTGSSFGTTVQASFGGTERAVWPFGEYADTLLAMHSDANGSACVTLVPRGSCTAVAVAQRLDGASVSLLKAEQPTLSRCERIVLNQPYAEMVIELQAAQCLFASVSQVVTMGRMVQETRDYLATRQQFGTKLIKHEALMHRLVDIYVKYELCRASVFEHVSRGETGDRASLLRNRLYVQQCAREAAHEVIQLHGGMGMTTDLLAGRLARLTLAMEFAGGDRHCLVQGLAPTT
ncbi:acyl-CoA dehydrogenase [Ottowia thiooxydans]|uniref:Alkylation response protein AidB-like acyl-CoA dehydrogenase n=1 Tax=Ottowia thiooxydans TaxID=219182 RepID=A0ABV2Q1M0_9BURK